MGISGLPTEGFIAETLELEFKAVQPPDFWTTLRDASWPDYPPIVGEVGAERINQAIVASQEMHSVRMWSPKEADGVTREENSSELTIAMEVLIAWVVKCVVGLQRQVFMARADMRHLIKGNPDRKRPGYSGANDWGLTSSSGASPMRVDYLDSGLAVVWWAPEIEFRFKLPKG